MCKALPLDPLEDWVEIWIVKSEDINVMPDIIRQLKEWKDMTLVVIHAVDQTGYAWVRDIPTAVCREVRRKKMKEEKKENRRRRKGGR